MTLLVQSTLLSPYKQANAEQYLMHCVHSFRGVSVPEYDFISATILNVKKNYLAESLLYITNEIMVSLLKLLSR